MILKSKEKNSCEKFLERLHQIPKCNIVFSDRLNPANRETEAKYFWAIDDKIEIIKNLTIEDVADKAPEQDLNRPDEICYFFSSARKSGYGELYIKIAERPGKPLMIVISLHENY